MIHVGNGNIRNTVSTPGTAVTALVIGQYRKTQMQQRPDELSVFIGVFGKTVNNHHSADRIISLIGNAEKRMPVR